MQEIKISADNIYIIKKFQAQNFVKMCQHGSSVLKKKIFFGSFILKVNFPTICLCYLRYDFSFVLFNTWDVWPFLVVLTRVSAGKFYTAASYFKDTHNPSHNLTSPCTFHWFLVINDLHNVHIQVFVYVFATNFFINWFG